MRQKLKNIYDKIYKTANLVYDKDLMHFSASLSFHTLLSIIPVLLISFSIFTQLPSFDEYYIKIKNFVFSSLLPTHQDTVSTYVEQFLKNSSSLGFIGFGAIIFTSIMFFSDYEYIINKITGAKSRGFWRNVSSYWTLITLAPLGLGASFFLSNKIQSILDSNYLTDWINILVILPYIIIWAIFCVTYTISINKKIDIKNIIIASFLASLAWDISKIGFVAYAVYNKTYLSIYGSFSVLLFFFVWIYLSWIIFLYGVRICKILDDLDKSKKWQNSEQNDKNSDEFVSNGD
ncbi:virulence factor, BrkB family protein [Campylobacter sputorum bv. paraureolyticus LMG 11764]|nr:virulence factor, BrkB family protein [Campylobacter sputorum bv. paraureolyticus LMG 11764]